MTATTPLTSGPGLARLTLLHAKYGLIETLRVPIAVVGSFAFPSLALLAFVVPQRAIAGDPYLATQAVVSLAVFSVMANGLFTFGLSMAEAREKPWDPYMRTLPSPGLARILAQVLATGAMGLVSLVPLVAIGAVATEAEASVLAIGGGLLVIAVCAVPFLLTGAVIGLALPFKAAVAAIQIVMFGLAFLGGLFLPPMLFPEWLAAFSQLTPTRQARDLVIAVVQGGAIEWWTWAGILAWTLVLLALALALFRRDEGKRYR